MEKIENILINCGAAQASALPYKDCTVINARLLQRLSFEPKSVYICIIPYYTHYCDEPKTVSAYALARDYHLYLNAIGSKALEMCKNEFPDSNFAFYGDHSPIDEKQAAAKAGLGIIGRNGLLITQRYSSYVFICELFSDNECINKAQEINYCENCGACFSACPASLASADACASAITQKKGDLTEYEIEIIRETGCVWGCDICQEICPHTVKAKKNGTIYTNTEWFNTNIISNPSISSVEDAEDFKMRAYSWRGAPAILRNIKILSEKRK